MKWFIIFCAGLFVMLIMQCYRDEAVNRIGFQAMCAKLSATMQEYEQCIKGETNRIKAGIQD